LRGDDAIGEFICNPKRYASHFKRYTQNRLGLGIDIEVV
jgi:hypothetical protein